MTLAQLESRVAALETEISQLKARSPARNKAWIEEIWGSFANDPLFDEAMREGRKWREGQRPRKPGAKSRGRNGRVK